MYTQIVLELSSGKLQMESFHFTLMGFRLVLNSYNFYEKETNKHKFKCKKSYDRLMKRNCNIGIEQVPLSTFIKKMALEKLMKSITVETTTK